MSRTVWVAVLGEKRAHKHNQGHEEAQEAPAIMIVPLIVLAIFSMIGGFIGIPHFLIGENANEMPLNIVVAVTSTLVALFGISAGTLFYARLRSKEDPLKKLLGKIYEFIVKKYYLDEFFSGIANFFQSAVAKVLFWFDWNVVIQKMVNGAAGITSGFASILRLAQTGAVQTYAAVFSFGVAAILYFMLMRG